MLLPLLQEVTQVIASLWSSQSPWWSAYHVSEPPPGAPYFSLLALKKGGALRLAGWASSSYTNSIMGESQCAQQLQIDTHTHTSLPTLISSLTHLLIMLAQSLPPPDNHTPTHPLLPRSPWSPAATPASAPARSRLQ